MKRAVYTGFSDKLIFRLTVEVASGDAEKDSFSPFENAGDKERNISAVYFTVPQLSASPLLSKNI